MHLVRLPKIIPPILFAFTLLAGFSCDNNDDETPQSGTLSIVKSGNTCEGARGAIVDITLQLEAENGIASLDVSVDELLDESITVDDGAINQTIVYNFNVPADALLNQTYTLFFILVDKMGTSFEGSLDVVTIASLEAPSTYEFDRSGFSAVSFTDQTDRLNMLEEIATKILNEGDAGNIISEQALLDAFENAGNNGGGVFSFTSESQLKDKTFQADLNSGLFEDLFSRAAAASVDGNGGVQASNGTAGLITRETGGNTILVDENGRAFSQLIEIGLMGAVFYNEIFNEYLTDERIGNSVENTVFVDERVYTEMENNWDQAFGYWGAPLDFSSSWPESRIGETRFWSFYSNLVDDVANDLLGTNSMIMDAYIQGRTAISNNDLTGKDQQRDVLYENLELVAAAAAVHFINAALNSLADAKSGDALYNVSGAWAFCNALRYSPNSLITLDQLNIIMEINLGADGNFWNVTPESLTSAKANLVNTYPKLAPVQDDL